MGKVEGRTTRSGGPGLGDVPGSGWRGEGEWVGDGGKGLSLTPEVCTY